MSYTTFSSLPGVSPVVVSMLRSRGILDPFEIQLKVIPLAMTGIDVLAQAPTGSGKTLAFGLPIIARAAGRPREQRGVDALVLVPTRELAVQVCDDLSEVAQAHGLSTVAVYGGAGIGRQVSQCRRADILIATPGRLTDLEERGAVRFDSIRTLVLDEADRMLDMGFAPQVDRITRLLPRERQTMLFSATLDAAVRQLVNHHTNEAVTVRVTHDAEAIELVEHVFEPTSPSQRVETLVRVLDSEDRDQAVVFVRTKRGADRLNRKLRAYGIRSTAMHGGMTQSARLRELSNFRDGRCDTIVATDVFSRGLDLDSITHVINYDPPMDADTYMHRVGRTGRAGRGGFGISLVAPDEEKIMLAIAHEIGLHEQTNT